MQGWTAKDIPAQTGKIIVITGANSGVGYESALALARKGAHIVMACRSLDKAETARQDILRQVPGGVVDVMQLDLGSLKSVHTFADAFNTRYPQLDVLMNNAGIMMPPYAKTVDGFESQFGTNHLGHFALTGLLLPKLLETPKSRIVTVSSSAYSNGRINFDDLQSERSYRAWSAYGQSKLANILFSTELERKLQADHSDTISIATHPGHAVTNLQNNPGNPLIGFFMQLMNSITGQPADQGATYQLYAATSPDAQAGEFYGPKRTLWGEVVRVGLNARARNTADAARLWQISEQLTGVRYEFAGKPVFA